ncbi:MAG: dTDP-4-dehydrorhamnose reductase [Patescibacteria group bacterium]|jgi:dTDP-4-dehydrorhamnose reductase
MKILIIGAKGMLGQEIVQIFSNSEKHEVVAWDKSDIDIINFNQTQIKIELLKPVIVINCAAYNNVDKAEDEPELAYLLNSKAVENLARVCKLNSMIFVHYSTDYIFEGDNQNGYLENDKPNPQSVYAKSKLAGEEAVQKIGGKFYIIRLSRLFGKPAVSENAKKSFVDIMLNLAEAKKEIEVVDEEYSSPTYAPDLAQATFDIIKFQSPYGIYHRTNNGDCTWFEFAKEIFKQRNLAIKLVPVSGDKFQRIAKRPKFSQLISTKLPPLRPWQEALADYLNN